MKKKGFTLVELLAVIAILAILVIMALPAVLRMYREARIDSFQNEVRKVVSTAQQQFMADVLTIGAGKKLLYTRDGSCTVSDTTSKTLEMTGNSNFTFYVLINVKGEVEAVRATNGTYSYKSKSTNKNINVQDIEVNSTSSNDATLESNIADICSGS